MRYHSAMKKYGGVSKSEAFYDANKYTGNGILAFQHNICDGVPELYEKEVQ